MHRLTKNMVYQTVYQILAVLVSVVTTPIITRTLGDVGLGMYSYTCAIVNYFAIFASLGINTYGVREIARIKVSNDKKRLSKTFWGIYGLQIILSISVIIIYYSYIFIYVEKYKILAIIQGTVLLNNLTDISWFFFGIEQFKITVTRNTVIKLACLILIVFCIKTPDDVYLYALIMAGSLVVSNIILLIEMRKHVSFEKVTAVQIFRHLKPNIILFIPVISASIFAYMDKIMLGYISGAAQNGYYEAMERIISIPFACISALSTVMFPRISALMKQGGANRSLDYLYISFMGTVGFTIACFFGMWGVADIFIPIFLGKDFLPAINTVILGCLILLPRGIREVVKAEYLLPKGLDKFFSVIIIGGAVSNLIANILLIPVYGANGAVFATIFSETVSCVIVFFLTGKEIPYIKMLMLTLPFLIFGLLMSYGIRVLKNMVVLNSILKLIILVGVGGAIYIVLCVSYFMLLKKKINLRG